jgi:signal transduction histidine kinase
MSAHKLNFSKVSDVADAMRRDYNPSTTRQRLGKTIFLLGAGCSVTAGIPLAKDIAKELVCRLALDYSTTNSKSPDPIEAIESLIKYNKLPKNLLKGNEIDWNAAYNFIFTTHYVTPKETKPIFFDICDRAAGKLNWAHLCIGELVRSGYVATVLTTNFDQLALEGIARTGRLPVVADGLESLNRINGDPNYPQLIQIHGSRHTYYLRNSIADTDLIGESHAARHAIDELMRNASVFVAIGYGGRERGLMKLLIEGSNRWPDTRIFWTTFPSDTSEINDNIRTLMNTSRYSSVIIGQDADLFFLELLDLLGMLPPMLIQDPMYIVKEISGSLVGSTNKRISDLLENYQNQVVRINAFHKTGEEPAAFSVHSRDIDEVKQLKEELIQSQKMQAVGQLAGGIAHDFNNMLTAIVGYTDLLLASCRPSDPPFQDLMQIKMTANRATSLTRQLLAFARRQSFHPQAILVSEVLAELEILLRRLVGETIQVDLTQAQDIWFVCLDINQLEQIIINLVVNARDAMPEAGGKIQLRVRNVPAAECASFREVTLPLADYVLVEVEDNGKGIPKDIIGRIFEPFFTTKEVGKGSGLGLSMVYGIVKQSNGFIFVSSELGKGTTFLIFFPRYMKPPEDRSSIPEGRSSKEGSLKRVADFTRQGTILIVEDEEAVRSFIARVLVSRGYTVRDVASGIEGLKAVNELDGKVDLIISNVVMPEMDGPTMFVELRKRGVKAKMIFISGYAEEALAKKLPKVGFSFMPKPFTKQHLIEKVKECMELT